MTTLTLRNYLSSLFPGVTIINGASTKSPSISVFPGPEARNGRTPFLCGAECNDFKKLPVNILVRWSDDTDASFKKAREVYSALSNKHNFTFESADIAYIFMLDDNPVWLGRDSENVVEYVVRADIYYFTGE